MEEARDLLNLPQVVVEVEQDLPVKIGPEVLWQVMEDQDLI
jgi:hypothetical protein